TGSLNPWSWAISHSTWGATAAPTWMWRSMSSVASRSRRLASGTRGSGIASLSFTGVLPPRAGRAIGLRRGCSSAHPVGARLGGDLLGVEAVDLVDQVVRHQLLRGHRLLDDARLQHEVGVGLVVRFGVLAPALYAGLLQPPVLSPRLEHLGVVAERRRLVLAGGLRGRKDLPQDADGGLGVRYREYRAL